MIDNMEVEKAALGCALIDGTGASHVMKNMEESAFEAPKHRQIFRHMKKLWEEGTSVDMALLSQSLSADRASLVGVRDLIALTNAVSTTDYVGDYCKKATIAYYEREVTKEAAKLTEDPSDAYHTHTYHTHITHTHHTHTHVTHTITHTYHTHTYHTHHTHITHITHTPHTYTYITHIHTHHSYHIHITHITYTHITHTTHTCIPHTHHTHITHIHAHITHIQTHITHISHTHHAHHIHTHHTHHTHMHTTHTSHTHTQTHKPNSFLKT